MKTEVVVNGRFLARRTTGVERYAGEILRGLGAHGAQVQIARPKRAAKSISGHAWEQFFLPRRLSSRSTLWSPANSGPLLVSNQVLTLHDLTALEHPEWFKPAFTLWYRLLIPALVRRVKAIITPSEYVRQKAIRRFGLPAWRVTVVSGGVDASRFHPAAKITGAGRYVLFAGSLEPRKNLAGLIAAWNMLAARHPDVRLVAAGGSGRVFRRLKIPAGLERVHFTGYVSDAELAALYAGAEVFVFPSLDEGFGLPALEAMACGAPVLASTRGALPEVIGDAGLFFDPADVAQLVGFLEQCLCDAHLRRSLAARGLERASAFTWAKAAEKTWQVLKGNDAS